MLQSAISVLNKAVTSGASYGSTLASGSAIAITAGNYTYLLTGTTAVNTMTGGASGSIVTLAASGQATGVCVVLNHATSTNNLDLRDNLNLGIYAGESVTFMFDGTKWVETARNLKTVLSYTEITSNATSTAASESAATAAITPASAITYDGATPICVEFWSWDMEISGGTSARVALYDDSSSIGLLALATGVETIMATRRFTPSAASRTYSARLFRAGGGTAIISAGVGGSGDLMPAYFKISRDL